MRGSSLAALAATILLAAGCGDSPSLKDLRTNAGAACSRANARESKISTPASPAQEETFLSQGARVLSPELSQLRSLKAPSEVGDVYRVAVGAFAQKVDAVNQTLQGLNSGEDPVIAMKALQRRLGPLESQEDGAWRSLQIPACMNQ